MATENNAQMLISIDEYLSGIRDAFDRLAQELEVTQKQRDEYKETGTCLVHVFEFLGTHAYSRGASKTTTQV